jgi:hypothetical protein
MSFLLEEKQQTERHCIRQKLDLRPLKKFVTENVEPRSAFFKIIVTEPDGISCEEFLVKFGVWLKLLKFEAEARHK